MVQSVDTASKARCGACDMVVSAVPAPAPVRLGAALIFIAAVGLWLALGAQGLFATMVPQIIVLTVGVGLVPPLWQRAFRTVHCSRCQGAISLP